MLGDGAVLFGSFLAAALVQATVKQNGRPRGPHHVLGAGNLTGCPDTLDFSQSPLL
jgi:hypothetical protein